MMRPSSLACVTLLEARPNPHILDDYTVDRLIAVYTASKRTLSRKIRSPQQTVSAREARAYRRYP